VGGSSLQENKLTNSTARNTLGLGVQLWVAGTLGALSILWITIITELDRDHELLIRKGELEAASLANNYAQQINYLFLQIDQLSLLMAAAADTPSPQKSLQNLFDSLPKESQINPVYVDEHGIVRSARGSLALNTDVSKEPFFIGYRDSESLKLKVQKPAKGFGRLEGKSVIRFSRRILKKDGQFAGVISIGLIKDELTNFIASGSLHSNDVVGLKFSNGEWLSFEVINQKEQKPPTFAPMKIGSSPNLE
jgi:hypothetical protein